MTEIAGLVQYLQDSSGVAIDPRATRPGWTEAGWQAMCRAIYEDWARTCPGAACPPLAAPIAAATSAVAGTVLGKYAGCLRTYLVTREVAAGRGWRSIAVLSTGEALAITTAEETPPLDLDGRIAGVIVVTVLRPAIGLVNDLNMAHVAAGTLLWRLANAFPGSHLIAAPARDIAEFVGVDSLFEAPLSVLLAVGDSEERNTP